MTVVTRLCTTTCPRSTGRRQRDGIVPMTAGFGVGGNPGRTRLSAETSFPEHPADELRVSASHNSDVGKNRSFVLAERRERSKR